MQLRPSMVLANRYELKAHIATGGMGEVWEARDLRLGRAVAVKTVNPHFLASDPAALAILRDEAKAGAHMIGDPNVVSVLDLGEHDDAGIVTHFIVMEYIDGPSLDTWISGFAPNVDPTTRYALNLYLGWQLCGAVDRAHKRGLLHRDVKPLNAFVGRSGILKVGDFGLARFADAITRTHTVGGMMSFAYAAPEQWNDEEYTSHTDVYQLGCALYHLFAGKPPFHGKGKAALMKAHLHDAPVPLGNVNAWVGETVSEAVQNMLEKDRGARANLGELNNALVDEFFGEYDMNIEVGSLSERDKQVVVSVMDVDLEPGALAESFGYVDTTEAMAEGIALTLAGIHDVHLKRRPRQLPEASMAPKPLPPGTSPPAPVSAGPKVVVKVPPKPPLGGR